MRARARGGWALRTSGPVGATASQRERPRRPVGETLSDGAEAPRVWTAQVGALAGGAAGALARGPGGGSVAGARGLAGGAGREATAERARGLSPELSDGTWVEGSDFEREELEKLVLVTPPSPLVFADPGRSPPAVY